MEQAPWQTPGEAPGQVGTGVGEPGTCQGATRLSFCCLRSLGLQLWGSLSPVESGDMTER